MYEWIKANHIARNKNKKKIIFGCWVTPDIVLRAEALVNST